MEKISTDNAPQAAGHYSQGVIHNGLVYVSGQLAIDPRTRKPVNDSIEAETEQALRNVEAVLIAANSDFANLLQMTIYVSDVELWGKVNEVYARVLGDAKPARAIVPVKELHYGLRIEIQAIGAVKK